MIDEALDAHLGKWKLGEIGAVERAILRLGAYEIKFTNTQSAIVINEAILLANELGSDSSTRFINGVLDAISKVN
ncbi:Transcription termination protein NusB [Campylobacter fetus subsp. venerealis str. 84-112]|nr:Transcription termination protein NusB [Campylobacter fetus subsp. venerealis str. 84-112]